MSEWARQAAVTAAVGVVAATGAIYMLGALAGSAVTFAPQGAAGLADARSRAGRAESSGEKEPARSTTSSGVGAAGSGAAIYESTKAVDEYLLFHFAPVRAGAAVECLRERATEAAIATSAGKAADAL